VASGLCSLLDWREESTCMPLEELRVGCSWGLEGSTEGWFSGLGVFYYIECATSLMPTRVGRWGCG
jgi:hypothetical protein